MSLNAKVQAKEKFSSKLHPDEIRSLFSRGISDMYRAEVKQYGSLLALVADVNAETLRNEPELRQALERNDELDRLSIERHGAIRLGTPEELFNIRRMFAVLGMQPVGYYDLSVAGVPVHSTAFRPVTDDALRRNPFRVFTSLLRLELIEDEAFREEVASILSKRQIFTPRALALIAISESEGGLDRAQAEEFVEEVLETFRWHSDSTVTLPVYQKMHAAHRVVADVASFRGPHINHLTPRTLDIDAVHIWMRPRGIVPKAVIEGPPRRECPILLRQTSFKALEETIKFSDGNNGSLEGTHAARFGEIEQRGVALTPKGRKLYDELLSSVRLTVSVGVSGSNAVDYNKELEERFQAFPDSWSELRKQGLAYFRYTPTAKDLSSIVGDAVLPSLDQLIAAGYLRFDPIVYEDFLPVSAAGIFQSNLGTDEQRKYSAHANRHLFEQGLGVALIDEIELYAQAEKDSIELALAQLVRGVAV